MIFDKSNVTFLEDRPNVIRNLPKNGQIITVNKFTTRHSNTIKQGIKRTRYQPDRGDDYLQRVIRQI